MKALPVTSSMLEGCLFLDLGAAASEEYRFKIC